MKHLFSLLLGLILSSNVEGQPVLKHQFFFNLIDSAYNFNFEQDFYQVRVIENKGGVKILARDFIYQIVPNYGTLSVENKMLCCTYSSKVINHCNFTIKRKAPFGEKEMKFGVSHLQNNDFANISFFPNRQIAFVMPQNPDDRFYILKAGKSKFGGRDISCFLYDECTPDWVLSEKGKERRDSLLKDYSAEINQKLANLAKEKLKQFLPNGLDTIMARLVCETSYCSNPVGMINCQLTADTSCKSALFEYRIKGFVNHYDQKIIIKTKYPDEAWFTYPAYENTSLSFRDTTIISRDVVREKLLHDKSFAEVFSEETTLSYLALLPQFVKQKPININGLLEANPISEIIFDNSSPDDFPMLGYSFTNEEMADNGNVVVYQYWINGRSGEVFRKTTFSYNLLDE